MRTCDSSHLIVFTAADVECRCTGGTNAEAQARESNRKSERSISRSAGVRDNLGPPTHEVPLMLSFFDDPLHNRTDTVQYSPTSKET